MFLGYPSIMTTFANELMRMGMALDFPPLKHIHGCREVIMRIRKISYRLFLKVSKSMSCIVFLRQAAIATRHCIPPVYHEDLRLVI